MTYQEAIKEIGVNTEETLKRFSGNEELMKKFINMFPQDQSLNELNKAVNEKNYSAIKDAAHTLKGVSGNLGFTELYELSAILVKAIRENNYTLADEYYPKVLTKGNRINEIIKNIN